MPPPSESQSRTSTGSRLHNCVSEFYRVNRGTTSTKNTAETPVSGILLHLISPTYISLFLRKLDDVCTLAIILNGTGLSPKI